MPSLMSKKIVMVGGGGHCVSVIDAARSSSKFDDIVITDKELAVNTVLCGSRVVGNDEVLSSLFRKGYTNAFISVGSITDTTIRRNLYHKIKRVGFEFPCIEDGSSIVSKNAQLEEGVFVGKGAVINGNCEVDKFAIINSGSIIEHNCKIGEFSHVSVGAVICGDCIIGKDVFIGANTTIIQGLKVGDNSIIGAGSLVLRDVPENVTVYGTWA